MTHESTAPTAECIAQVWVRAPDLAPDTVICGDTRVKISAECPAVEHVSLGLRFKERSFVKALRSREDVKRLNPEPPDHDYSDTSLWELIPSRFANKTDEAAHQEVVTNKDLWIVQEEERLVFETTQPINMGIGDHGILRDHVQEFSIFVPSTNFPPVLDAMRRPPLSYAEREVVKVEWIYEYFAEISFANGTKKEVSAGFTTFKPLHNSAYDAQGLTSATVDLKQLGGMPTGWLKVKDAPVTNYSIELYADSGLTFFAGSNSHSITAVLTRTGYARTFPAPLTISARIMTGLSSKWVARYDMSNANLGFDYTLATMLRAEPNGDLRRPYCRHDPGVSVLMPNSTLDEIQAKKVVTTRSEAFTILVEVDDIIVPTFETYYQTLSSSLVISLETPLGEDENVDPDNPSDEHVWGLYGPQFDDDEEAWVPWEKLSRCAAFKLLKVWQVYSGRVPAVVHPARAGTAQQHCRHMRMGVDMSDETDCESGQYSLSHYLDEGARGPVFVDRSAVHELLAKDPVDRNLHAPILEPVVSSPPEGEALPHRYYRNNRMDHKRPQIYVGETWAKRVADKDCQETRRTSITFESRCQLGSCI